MNTHFNLTNEQREARREERYRAIIAISDLYKIHKYDLRLDTVYSELKTPTISRKTLKRIYHSIMQSDNEKLKF
jgi:hypothetical protein